MVATIMPNKALSNPLTTDFPVNVDIRVRAKKVTEKYSHGPNLRVKIASVGESTTITRTPMIVPISEPNTPRPRAFPA